MLVLQTTHLRHVGIGSVRGVGVRVGRGSVRGLAELAFVFGAAEDA